MTSLSDHLVESLNRLGVRDGTAIVAVSGGPDSVAMLLLMAGLAFDRGLELVVAHFDHGIHPDSADVACRVEALARARRLRFEGGRAALGPLASETRARDRRLEWFEHVRARTAASWILTAHHLEDQAETLVMRFLNGSGPAGLAGISGRRGPYRRPLLGVTRQALHDYLKAVGEEAWEDPANADQRHLRAWVRHEVIPLLASRIPALSENLSAGATQFEEHRQAWDEMIDQLPGVDFRSEPEGASVAAAGLAGYSSVIVRAVIRAVGQRLGMPLGRGPVGRVETLLAEGRTGQRVDLVGGWSATLEFDRLRLLGPLGHLVGYEVALPTAHGSIAAGGWHLATAGGLAPDRLNRSGFSTWLLPGQGLSVRSWRPGDRIRPLGGSGSKLVVRCMLEEKIPRHRRPNWPVIVTRDEIIWVPGVCRSGARLPAPGTEATRIDASPG